MKFKEFLSFVTTQAIMVCLLTFNPMVAQFGSHAEASEEYTAGAKAGLMRMLDLQGSLKGYGAQNTFAALGPKVAEHGQKFIAGLSGKDKEILNTPEGVQFLKDHSRLSRVHALDKKINACVKNKQNKRNLDVQVLNSIKTSEYTGGCDTMLTQMRNGLIVNKNLDDFIKNLGKAQKLYNNEYMHAAKGFSDFQDKLHMQSLKNSIASYMSNRYKYEPDYISPETGKILHDHKISTISKMCKDEDDKSFCTSEQWTELKKFVDDKAKEIAFSQKKSTYQSARNNLRKSYNTLNTKLRKISIKVDEGYVWDSANITDEKTKNAWQDYQKTYIEEMQKQDGLLMMSEVLKDKGGGFRTLEADVEDKKSGWGKRYEVNRHKPYDFTTYDLKKAKEEIDQKVIAQAKQINTMAAEKRKQHKNWKSTGYAESDWGDWDRPEIIEQRKEDIQNLVKTNPAAVGQILLNNPEYADIVCDAINGIDKQDKSDEKWDSVFMIGGLVVAGVMIVGGGACIILSFGLCGPIGGATIAGGITVGSAAVGTALVVGAVEAAYWGKRTYDHHTEHQALERAIFSGNMDESRVGDVAAAYNAFKEARFNFLLALPAVVLPGVGKLASLSKGPRMTALLSKMGDAASKSKFLNKMTTFFEKFGKMLRANPKMAAALDKMISTGKIPAEKLHDFFSMLAQSKRGIDAKFLTWLSGKMDDLEKAGDATKMQKFLLKFKGIVDEGLEAATKACKI